MFVAFYDVELSIREYYVLISEAGRKINNKSSRRLRKVFISLLKKITQKENILRVSTLNNYDGEFPLKKQLKEARDLSLLEIECSDGLYIVSIVNAEISKKKKNARIRIKLTKVGEPIANESV